MIGQIGKDLHKAQNRILDHRVFVSGEIENFLENFETKRSDREVAQLFGATETTGELKYELSELCVKLGKAHLNEISAELTGFLANIEEFLETVREEKVPSDSLLQSRIQREQRKDIFCKDLQHGFQRVENSFEEKEEEIAELYSDLQLKLNIQK